MVSIKAYGEESIEPGWVCVIHGKDKHLRVCKKIRNQEDVIVQLLKRLYSEDFVFISHGSLCKVEESKLKMFGAYQGRDPRGLKAL